MPNNRLRVAMMGHDDAVKAEVTRQEEKTPQVLGLGVAKEVSLPVDHVQRSTQ